MEIDYEEKNKSADNFNPGQLENFHLKIELRKRKEKTIIDLTYEDFIENNDKILAMLKKECVDLKSWFFIIVSNFNFFTNS